MTISSSPSFLERQWQVIKTWSFDSGCTMHVFSKTAHAAMDDKIDFLLVQIDDSERPYFELETRGWRRRFGFYLCQQLLEK